MPILLRAAPLVVLTALAASCTHGGAPPAGAPVPVAAARAQPSDAPEPIAPPAPAARPQPVAPPEVAYRLGLMPLASAGVLEFRALHPTFDGRGVLVAILDSGVDPGVLGLQGTTVGTPKILDLRNFSGEGDVALEPVTADADGRIALPGGLTVGGAAAVRAAATGQEMYGGVLAELPFGPVPASDFNGNGTNRDRYGVVVVRGPAGWLVFVDTNGDGTFADETALADFLVRRETFTFSSRAVARGRGPITAAVNVGDDPERPGRPKLSFFLDTSGHGTHVAGIATGHDLYGVQGFDGVAPGAQVIALKIADNARGGVSTTGSMIRAMEYSARFAAGRGLPLVMNMSFGIGNEIEGGAAMDSLVDAFLLRHPDVVFAISAGNDGPGTSTMGLPASAELALTVGAVYPASFARVQSDPNGRDVLGTWGSRGGELAKPDIVTPGIAYSSVPAWNTGGEIKLGTSMSTPYATGLVALLASAAAQEHHPAPAARLIQALKAAARPFGGATFIDQGYGLPRVETAYRWLAAEHEVRRLQVTALSSAPPPPPGVMRGRVAAFGGGPVATAAYRRDGLATPADTIQRFRLAALPGAPRDPGLYRLVPSEPWLHLAAPTVSLDANGAALVELHYGAAALAKPGRYVGTVYGYAATDTASGPVFALVNTVIVPETRPSLTVTRVADANASDRYYIRVPEGASGLSVRATVRDSTVPSQVQLFEPNGRPSRGVDRIGLGADGGARATAVLSANDAVPGTWEVVLQAPPGKLVSYDLQLAVPGIRVASVDSAAASPRIAFSATAAADTTVTVTADQLGVTRLRRLTIVDGAMVRDTVAAPAWAKKVVVEVWTDREPWDQLTDFSLTVYNAAGEQLGQGAMNYASNRFESDLPAKRPAAYPVQVELFPAFAHDTAPVRFDVRLRETFVGDARHLQVASGQGVGADSLALRIPARATAEATLSGFADLALPGWDDWVKVRAAGRPDDWIAVERLIAVRRAP